MTTQWNPADYAQHSSHQHAWGRELLAKLRLRGDERLLDLGCGDGKITADLAAALPRGSALGTDASADMIAFAQERFAGVPNLRFRQMDMRELTFTHEFDVVFSTAAMHWVHDHRPVLAGIARALKPGGRALLQMGGKGNIPGILAALDLVTPRPRWAPCFTPMPTPYGFHAPEDYPPWLAAAGLTATRVELIEKTMLHPDAAAFAAYFRTIGMPWTHRLPDSARPDFLAEVTAAYLHLHPPAADGAVTQKMIRLEVEATR